MLIRLLIVLVWLLWAPFTYAGDVITSELNGKINWTTGDIQAVGFGAAPEGTAPRKQKSLALRAAKIVALRNLLEIVQGVRVTSETTVLDLMLVSDIVHTRVTGIVRGAQVQASSFDEGSGLASVTMQLKVTEGLYKTLIDAPDLRLSQTKWPLTDLLSSTLALLSTALAANAHADITDDIEYTGIVFDVTGLRQFQPAAILRLRDDMGKVFYPTESILKDRLSGSLLTLYGNSLETLTTSGRIGETPLIIEVDALFQTFSSDLQLRSSDVKRLKGNETLWQLIERGRVAVLMSVSAE